jgi:CSLREA domain-containing protein
MNRRGLIGVATLAVLAATTVPAGAATIKVNTLEDGFDTDGKCAFREAVEAANENKKEDGCVRGESKRDTIRLKEADYPLSFITSNEDANANGDFDFTGGGPVTVLGAGKTKTEIFQNSDDRIIDVHDDANVTLSRLRLGSGDVSTLGASEGRGGNARVLGGTLKIGKSIVSSSDAVVGGGAYADENGKLRLTDTEMGSTDATVAGGALASQQGATLNLTRVTISNVDATSSTASVRGGIIASDGGGLVKVTESTLQGSTAHSEGNGHSAAGGAIYVSGDLFVQRSLIQGNGTEALDDNDAEHGGAIYVASGDTRIVNSTLFNNRAGAPGDNDGLGGAVFGGSGSIDIQHTTLDSNQATSAGDAVAQIGANVELLANLLDDEEDPCFGDVESAGYNVSEDPDPQADCGFDVNATHPDIVNTATGTIGLGDNGGPTQTIAINSASPARDFVPKNICKPATSRIDQRGFERPRGPRCDSGAFEFNAQP